MAQPRSYPYSGRASITQNPIPAPNQTPISGTLDGKPSITLDLIPEILTYTPIKHTLMFWGKVGVGKSGSIMEFAEKEGLEVFDIRLSQLDSVDLRGVGFPDLEAMLTKWLPPDFLPRKREAILFLDEINSGLPTVQTAAYQLCLDRRLGNYHVPEGVRVLSAGNEESDRGITFRIAAPLANRMSHYKIELDIGIWRDWAVKNEVAPEIITFLSVRPELLHNMTLENCKDAFPSPRSWVKVSDVWKTKAGDYTKYLMMSSNVGKAVAEAFLTTREQFAQLGQDPLKILTSDNHKPHSTASVGMATMMATAVALNCKSESSQIRRACEYFLQMDEEFGNLGISLLESRFTKNTLSEVEAYVTYKLKRKIVKSKQKILRPGSTVINQDGSRTHM